MHPEINHECLLIWALVMTWLSRYLDDVPNGKFPWFSIVAAVFGLIAVIAC